MGYPYYMDTMWKCRRLPGARGHAAVAILLALSGLVPLQMAGAATVYKSVDEEGRVTFSDQPPDHGELVQVLEYRDVESSRSAQDTAWLDAMRETTDRMAADRREREATRARARAEAAAAWAAAQPPTGYSDDTYYTGGTGGYSLAVPVVRPPLYGPPHYRPPHYRPPHYRPPHYRPPQYRPPGYRPPHGRPPEALPAAEFNPKQFKGPGNIVRRNYSGRAREIFYGR